MTDVKVKQFRQIVFWPLEIDRFHARQGLSEFERVQAFAEFFTLQGKGKWKRHADLLGRPESSRYEDKPERSLLSQKTAAEKESEYAELLYFNPQVRKFLYGAEGQAQEPKPGHAPQKAPPVCLFYRDDVKMVSVEFMLDQRPCVLKLMVDRVYCYVFAQGIAFLVVEFSAKNLSLAQTQQILDQLRRTYPPSWETDSRVASHCLQKVSWNYYSNPKDSHFDVTGHFREFAVAHKAPLPFEHWQYLLNPLLPWQGGLDGPAYAYKELGDESMPFMAFLAVDEPKQLTRADFVRLCFADAYAAPTSLPCSQAYLSDFERHYCYDRYWDPQMKYDGESATANPQSNWMQTRFLCCGHGFVMVGKDDPKAFSDGKNGALAHFRRHYFQMGLLVYFQRAALQSFAGALADLAGRNERDKAVHDELRAVVERFTAFSHRCEFGEISSLTQARELYALWTGHLQIQARMGQVRQKVGEAASLLDRLARQRLAATSARLTVVVVVALVLGLLGAFLAVDWGRVGELSAQTSILPNAGLQQGRLLVYVAGWLALILSLMVLTLWKSEWIAGAMDKLANPEHHYLERFRRYCRRLLKKA